MKKTAEITLDTIGTVESSGREVKKKVIHRLRDKQVKKIINLDNKIQ